jgi:hypothetical protein
MTRTFEENVNRIREASHGSPRKSIRAAILQLRRNSTFNSALCATQKAPLRAYKTQMIHALKPSDQVARTDFAVDMRHLISSAKCVSRTR